MPLSVRQVWVKKSLFVTENTNEGVPFYYSYGLQCYEYRPQLPKTGGNVYYNGAKPCKQEESNNPLVISELLGKAKVPQAPLEDYDGTPLIIDTDYFGLKRNTDNPSTGPFENLLIGKNKIQVWPKSETF